MKICDNTLNLKVNNLFKEIDNDVKKILKTTSSFNIKTERIMNLVTTKLTTECEGYIYDMYFTLLAKIKEEEYFQDPDHLNAFYHLNLKEELNEKYHFEIDSLSAYKQGISFKEIDKLYCSAGATAGTFAVGGILKYILSGVVEIPFAVLIAGAASVAFTSYCKVIPEKNDKEFITSVAVFLRQLETEILEWLNEIEEYFNNRVKALYFNS